MDQFLPYSVDESLLKRRRIRKVEMDGQPMEQFLVVAVRKKMIDDMIDFFRHLKFDPIIMDLNLLAIENAYELSGDGLNGAPMALVDIGASATLIHVLHRGETLFTRIVPLGGASVTQAIQDRLNVSRFEAEGIKLGSKPPTSPRNLVEAISSEIERLARER